MKTENFWAKKKGKQLFQKAISLELKGKTREAMKAYQKSVYYWPKHAQAQYNLGVALATDGQIDQAIRAWNRALWLDSSFRAELSIAFDLDDELREEIVEYEFDDLKKAA